MEIITLHSGTAYEIIRLQCAKLEYLGWKCPDYADIMDDGITYGMEWMKECTEEEWEEVEGIMDDVYDSVSVVDLYNMQK